LAIGLTGRQAPTFAAPDPQPGNLVTGDVLANVGTELVIARIALAGTEAREPLPHR
jgi:hypothetical protein